MATLKDLSKKLGLSVTQVSRALNNHDDVSEATKQRVRRAAQELDYTPNMSARTLVSGRSGIVALVYPNAPDLIYDSLFFETTVNLSIEFSKRDIQFMLHIAPEDVDILTVYDKLYQSGTVDGFVVIEPRNQDERVEHLKSKAIPFVLHGLSRNRQDYPYFEIDNDDVGYQLTKCLLDQGHRRIAFLNGPSDRSFASLRYDGYLRALKDAGIPPDEQLVRYAHMTKEQGLLAGIDLLSTAEPTAFVTSSIRLAEGVYNAVAAKGLRVGHDISVVAHDDVMPAIRASAFYPALTVTRSPISQSWVPLVEALTAHIQDKTAPLQQITAPVQLVERASHLYQS